MASSADDSTDLDRLADAVVPSFRRKPSLPPPSAEAVPVSPAVEAAPAAVKLENPEIPAAPRVPAIEAAPANPTAEDVGASVPKAPPVVADRNDATPIDLPQVVLPAAVVSATSTQPDPHEAATVPPPQPLPAAKPKKQLRSVPEPSVKAEAQLHTPAPRVVVREETPKIVFNDPQAPSRLPTMPMSAVRITGLEANRVTLRPQKKRAASPLIPAIIALVAVAGAGVLLLGGREDRQPLVKTPAPQPAPAAPVVAAPAEEPERFVPPPPPAEEVAAEEPSKIEAPPEAAVKVAPKAVAPAPASAAPAPAPAAPAAPAAASAPAARVSPPPPAAPVAAKAPESPPPAKPAAPAKASNSSAAPAIVRDNPF